MQKINSFASKLSTCEKRQAEEMMAKILASPNRHRFLYIEPSHIFYPYFYQQLTMYRQHPELRVEKRKEGAAGATSTTGGTAGSPSTSTTTTDENGVVVVVGGNSNEEQRQQLLQQAEEQGRRYQRDPFPTNLYTLNLNNGTLEVPVMAMSLIAVTAQYVCKYGSAFTALLTERYEQSPGTSFSFLSDADPRHELFTSLVASYQRILDAKELEVEERLVDVCGAQPPTRLMELLEEKTKYVRASVARREAALLTDDVLRQRLQWSYFSVVKTFTLADLRLDGPAPLAATSSTNGLDMDQQQARGPYSVEALGGSAEDPTAVDMGLPTPPAMMPVPAAPVYMSSRLVRPSDQRGAAGGEDHLSVGAKRGREGE